MFDALLQACAGLGETGSPYKASDHLAKNLPSEYCFQDIVNHIVDTDETANIGSLRAILVCLNSHPSGNSLECTPEAANKIAEYVAKNIIPISPDSGHAARDWEHIAFKGALGLAILRTLQEEHHVTLDPRVLLTITIYTSVQDPWMLAETAPMARTILDEALTDNEKKTSLITSTILSDFLRPLFSKSRPATVTASGRKAEFVETTRYSGSLNDPSELETKPWKHAHRYAISVFEWAVQNSDEAILSNYWHLYTPVLLTLIDEPQTEIKVRTMHTFSIFWRRCPPGQMARVGLADVFEQAIFPAVLHLPTLTPEDESIQILDAAYPALFQIAGLPNPEEAIGEGIQQLRFTEAQRKLLDKIIRQGILIGYHHASEHIRLNELFCKKTSFLVNGMGILAVKHLKDFFPLISDIMTEPFGTKYPPALLAATQLLQVIMQTCWPRINGYKNEIIRILAICYLNIHDEEAFPNDTLGQEELQSALSRTAEILGAILKAENIVLMDTVSQLIEKEHALKPLFIPTSINSVDAQK